MIKNKKATTTSIIGVALASALIFVIGLVFSTLREYQIKTTIDDVGSYHVKYENIPFSKIGVIKNNKNVDKYELISIEGTVENETIDGLNLIAAEEEQLKNLNIKIGRLPQNNNEIIVSQYYYGKEKISINDKIVININNEEESFSKKYEVVGVYFSNLDFSLYTYETNFENKNVNITVYFKKINNKILEYSNSLASAFGLESYFDYDLKVDTYRGMNLNSQLLELYGIAYDLNQLIYLSVMIIFMLIILSIISLVCFFVVYNAFEIAINERKKMFATLSSIGATPKQIFSSIFLESILISVVGIVIGFAISYGMVYGLTVYIDKQIGDLLIYNINIGIYPIFIYIPVMFITFVIFLATLFPANRAKNTTIIEAIRQNDEIVLKSKKIKSNKIIRKLGIEVEYARKNVKRNKRKYGVTLVSIVISIILFISFSTIFNIFMKIVDQGLEEINDISISFSNTNNRYDALLKEIYTINSFDNISISSSSRYKIDTNLEPIMTNDAKELLNVKNEIIIIRVDSKTYNKYIEKLGISGYNGVVLNDNYYFNEIISDTMKYKVFNSNSINSISICNYNSNEDNVQNTLPSCDYQLSNLYVSDILPNENVFTSFGLVKIIIDETKFSDIPRISLFSSYIPYFINVETKNYIDFDKDFRLLMKDLGLEDDIDNIYYNNAINNHNIIRILNVSQTVLYTFIIFITSISIVSIYSTITTSLNLRRREFATLRSVGVTGFGFDRILLYESVMFCLKAIIISLPIAWLIINVIYKVLNFEQAITGTDTLGLSTISVPYKYIIISFVAVYIIVMSTTFLATRKIKNDNIADIIKTDI
jgi:putative ABC transport system permease protein